MPGSSFCNCLYQGHVASSKIVSVCDYAMIFTFYLFHPLERRCVPLWLLGRSAETFLRQAVARTDGRFRKRLFEAARAGESLDQRQILESSTVPVAVVNGDTDRFVNLDYFDTVAYANCGKAAVIG
jgi:hypothetical protein